MGTGAVPGQNDACRIAITGSDGRLHPGESRRKVLQPAREKRRAERDDAKPGRNGNRDAPTPR
jgi:hypothetical protein